MLERGLAVVRDLAGGVGLRAADECHVDRHLDLEHVDAESWLRELVHVRLHGLRLQLGELEAPLVHVLVVRERLEEERHVGGLALRADPLEERVLAVVHRVVVERVVVEEDLDRVGARLDEPSHAPMLEEVGRAVLRVGVVPGLLIRQ